MPTFPDTEIGYGKMWDRCRVLDANQKPAEAIARKAMTRTQDYLNVQTDTGVPWFVVAAIHNRESDMDFQTHLHNGDPLSARTVHVPRNRPAKGSPPFKWFDSAIDALEMPPHELQNVKRWSVERMLYEMEKYNGWGNFNRGVNSSYLWSWTTEYHGGKYVADGVFRSDAWDKQAGTVAIIKSLAAISERVNAALQDREATPPKDVIKEASAKSRNARKAGGAVAGAGGAGEATKAATGTVDSPLVHPVITYSLIGVGLVVLIVASVMIAKRTALVVAKWRGA